MSSLLKSMEVDSLSSQKSVEISKRIQESEENTDSDVIEHSVNKSRAKGSKVCSNNLYIKMGSMNKLSNFIISSQVEGIEGDNPINLASSIISQVNRHEHEKAPQKREDILKILTNRDVKINRIALELVAILNIIK